MHKFRSFGYITLADFLVRSAYQMGKTPLLPIFAAMLGASEAYLGFIVSVSTLTGLVLKPLIGILSDRWGRYGWLLLGTGFFAAMPFVYRFITTPEQLVIVRIIHGFATAIYGPVTLAFISEQTERNRAERLGWFGMARSAGYVVGPAAAGWLLLMMDPSRVFTVIGLISCLAFVPMLLLPKPSFSTPQARQPLSQQIRQALQNCAQTSAVWLSGGLEALMYVATYAVKAFLPLYALSMGVNIALIGGFFAIQEAVHMLLKPSGGRLGDRLGYVPAILLGMLGLGVALPLLTYANSNGLLILTACLLGAVQALISPATVALVSTQVDENNIGASMGVIGTLKNTGKVVGPILGGVLIYGFDFVITLRLISGLILLATAGVWYYAAFRQKLPTIHLDQAR